MGWSRISVPYGQSGSKKHNPAYKGTDKSIEPADKGSDGPPGVACEESQSEPAEMDKHTALATMAIEKAVSQRKLMGRFIAETKTLNEITLILAMEGNKETLRQLSGASDSLKYICGYEDLQAEDVIKLLGRKKDIKQLFTPLTSLSKSCVVEETSGRRCWGRGP